MKTRRFTRYFIRIAGDYSSFCESGWSGCSARLVARDKLKTAKAIKAFQVYGPEQAAAHIAELRRHVYDRRRPYARSTFEIVKSVTVEKVITSADIS